MSNNIEIQIAFIYANARFEALESRLRELIPQFDEQSHEADVSRRVYESLCRIENDDPAYAALVQEHIERAKAVINRRKRDSKDSDD